MPTTPRHLSAVYSQAQCTLGLSDDQIKSSHAAWIFTKLRVLALSHCDHIQATGTEAPQPYSLDSIVSYKGQNCMNKLRSSWLDLNFY